MLKNLSTFIILGIIFSSVYTTACRPPVGSVKNSTETDKRYVWVLSDKAKVDYYHMVLEAASRSGDLATAQYAVNQLKILAPSPQVYSNSASILLFQNKATEARAVLEKGLTLFADSGEISFLLAETYLISPNPDPGFALLDNFLRNYEITAKQRLQLSEMLLRIAIRLPGTPDQKDKASRLYREVKRVLSLMPAKDKDKYFHYFYGRVLLGLDDRNGERYLRRAVEEEPKFIEAWTELAYALEQRNDLAGAADIYKSMLNIDSENTAIWLRLVQINLKLNQTDTALTIAEQGPEDASFLLNAASLFMEDRYHVEAERLLLLAQGIPNAPDDVYFFLGIVAFQSDKDWREVAGRLAQINASSPNFERATQLRLRILIDENQNNQAIEVARAARQAHSDKPRYWITEGILLVTFERYIDALDTLGQAASVFKDDTDVLFAKGSVLEQAGRSFEALEIMENIIRIDPNYAYALNYIGYTLADKNYDLDRSLQLLELADAQMPNNPHILDSLAWVHYRLKNFQEAWHFINRAVELETTEPIIWDHYGDIAKMLGRKQDARRAWQRALELKPDNAVEIKTKLDNLNI
jgi:tetratricopeptide (TPR) repeat protein